jgi:hypothetical protein
MTLYIPYFNRDETEILGIYDTYEKAEAKIQSEIELDKIYYPKMTERYRQYRYNYRISDNKLNDGA